MANKLQIAKYAGVLTICFALGIFAGFNPLAVRVDHYAYDLMLAGQRETWPPQSVVVAIDEETLAARGGVRKMRSILAEALDKLYDSFPSAVAIDVIRRNRIGLADSIEIAATRRPGPDHVECSPRAASADLRVEPPHVFSQQHPRIGHCRRALLQHHERPSATLDRTQCLTARPVILETETGIRDRESQGLHGSHG